MSECPVSSATLPLGNHNAAASCKASQVNEQSSYTKQRVHMVDARDKRPLREAHVIVGEETREYARVKGKHNSAYGRPSLHDIAIDNSYTTPFRYCDTNFRAEQEGKRWFILFFKYESFEKAVLLDFQAVRVCVKGRVS